MTPTILINSIHSLPMYPQSFQKLIEQFSSLPGIGPKMAERLVLSLFKKDTDKLNDFARALTNLHDISPCTKCFNIAQGDQCAVCKDATRDTSKLCIVEEPLDIIPLERSRAFDGLYHVLGGTVTKKNSDDLTIHALLTRLETEPIAELIIATNFTTEGDMTAMHLKQILSDFKEIKISRLVRGLATGSDIEYADDMTIRSALINRETFL